MMRNVIINGVVYQFFVDNQMKQDEMGVGKMKNAYVLAQSPEVNKLVGR